MNARLTNLNAHVECITTRVQRDLKISAIPIHKNRTAKVPAFGNFHAQLFANDINDRGEITGESFDPNTQAAPVFLGIPVLDRTAGAGQAVTNVSQLATLPDKVRKHIERRLGPVAHY